MPKPSKTTTSLEAAMETTLAMMSRLMDRLAPLLGESQPRAESPWEASAGSSQILGARRRTQAAPSDGGEGIPRGDATTPQTLPVTIPAAAGRGTGQPGALFGQPVAPGGMAHVGGQSVQLQPPQQRREDLLTEFGGRSEDLDFFLMIVRGYLEDNAYAFRSEASQVRAVGAALRGGAASWYVQIHAQRNPCLGSARAFLAALEARFRDPLERVKARDRLKTIRVSEWSAQTNYQGFRVVGPDKSRNLQRGVEEGIAGLGASPRRPGNDPRMHPTSRAGRDDVGPNQEASRAAAQTGPPRMESRKPGGEPPKKEPKEEEEEDIMSGSSFRSPDSGAEN
ncbi:uncharacterized protein [Anolis sagrei]|uniref:uncharacterized protein isoform X1 n=1 Tax=Anolis sagrei TaxID=38937 RepID=UPI003521DD8D